MLTQTELVRLSRTNFAEAYQAAIHFKVLRTFVESVLRFGLPANYFAAVVRPNPRRVKQLIKSLVAEFSHLSEYMSKSDQNGEEAPTTHETPGEYANLLEQEVYPFVLTEQPMITV